MIEKNAQSIIGRKEEKLINSQYSKRQKQASEQREADFLGRVVSKEKLEHLMTTRKSEW